MLSQTGHSKSLPEELRKYFWDVAFNDISLEKYPGFIAERIMNLGNREAITWLLAVLDRDFINTLVRKSRNLTPKTRNYWQLMLEERPDNGISCYDPGDSY